MLAFIAILAQQNTEVEVDLTLPGVLALAAGVIILIWPTVLNYVIAAYLIVVGLVQIFDITTT